MQAQPLRTKHDYSENTIETKIANRIFIAGIAEKVEREHFLQLAKEIECISYLFQLTVTSVLGNDAEETNKALRKMSNEINILMQRVNYLQDDITEVQNEEIDAQNAVKQCNCMGECTCQESGMCCSK